MYKLEIYLDADGDFRYKSSYFTGYTTNVPNKLWYPDKKLVLIFKDKNSAIDILKDFYNELYDTLETNNHKYMIDTIKSFKPYMFNLINKYDNIFVEFNLGNPEFYIKLSHYDVIDGYKHNTNTNYKKVLENKCLEFYIYDNFKTDYEWDNILK